MALQLEQRPDDGEDGEDEDPGLGDDEQQVVQLEALTPHIGVNI